MGVCPLSCSCGIYKSSNVTGPPCRSFFMQALWAPFRASLGKYINREREGL